MTRYLTAHEAAAELGIRLETLYAYVSRGLIRSEATGSSKRTRRYLREDVQRLKTRKAARRNPEKLTSAALNWGTPLLESELTLIAGGHFYYRGQDAVELATQYRLEQVATFIWSGELPPESSPYFIAEGEPLPTRYRAALQVEATPFEAFQLLLPLAAVDDLAAYNPDPVAVMQTGGRIMRLLTAIAVGGHITGSSIAHTLQQSWTPDQSQAAALLNTAMILCADHELNVSAFTARCVASAGGTPYGVVIAGLAALQGVRHGGYTARVEAFFREASQSGGVRLALSNYLKRGETIPGFGHPLYPEGDPRCTALLQRITAAYPDSPMVALAATTAEEVFKLTEKRPTIDFGLVTLAGVLNLPGGTALSIFALGRTVGWLGHAIEQYQTNQLIRPRARYVGIQPPA